MHPEWAGDQYDIGSTRLQPRGPEALPPATPQQEFGLRDTAKREALQFSELIGLPGFITRTRTAMRSLTRMLGRMFISRVPE